MDNQLVRVTDPADPRRCKASTPTGQCMNEAERGAEYCVAHNAGRQSALVQDKRHYQLNEARWQAKFVEFSEDGSAAKSLRDEIALSRMMLQRRWELVKDDNQFLIHSPAIERTLLLLKDLIKTAANIEQKLGISLSREKLLAMGRGILDVLMSELDDLPDFDERMNRITTKIAQIMKKTAEEQQ